ncbi:MAG: MFS transporter [Bryobacterales bacterium]|nr:MFS transporter [Bryobacterales bacterium]
MSNIGTWMQNVGAAWLMTELAPSALLVALVQTATNLPLFCRTGCCEQDLFSACE